MARPHDLETSWQQTLLAPPPVLEVRVRLGFIPGEDHGRWMIEALDPQGGELLAMASRPHFPLHDAGDALAEVGRRLYDILEPLINPDPFP